MASSDRAGDSDRPSGVPEIAVPVRAILEHPDLRESLVLHAGASGLARRDVV